MVGVFGISVFMWFYVIVINSQSIRFSFQTSDPSMFSRIQSLFQNYGQLTGITNNRLSTRRRSNPNNFNTQLFWTTRRQPQHVQQSGSRNIRQQQRHQPYLLSHPQQELVLQPRPQNVRMPNFNGQSAKPVRGMSEQITGSFGIPSNYQTLILDSHNRYRAELHAADMYALKWNNQLAKESDEWARKCNWGHQKAGRGENLAYVTGGGLKMLIDYGLNGWYDEKNQYDGKDCMSTGSCHYTQMIWSTTTEVGCAAHRCPDMYYFVCFYSPPGNIMGIPPYQPGPPCSACSGRCQANLCHV